MKDTSAIALLLLSVGLFYTFTNAEYKEVKELQALANEYEDVLDEAEDIMKLRDKLLDTYSTISKSEIDRLNKVLPDNIDTVQMALDLDGIASRYGISIKSIKTTTDASIIDPTLTVLPEYAAPYDRANVSFSFVSDYDNFKLMLNDLEKSLRIMDLKAVSFRALESSLYEYSISVDTYWLK